MKRLLVIGGGFAGLWAALGAARQAQHHGTPLDIVLLSRDEYLVLRPRLYEPDPTRFRTSLRPVLETAGIRLVEGTATAIEADAHRVAWRDRHGRASLLGYDQLVLATGSELRRPPVPGLQAHGLDVDSFAASLALDRHLGSVLRTRNDDAARTVVVLGAGFTGIELVTALRSRIAAQADPLVAQEARIVLVDRNHQPAHELGPGPRPLIGQALEHERIELRSGRSVAGVDADRVTLDDGEQIPARTVIVTAGMVANPLGATLGAPTDPLGRLHTDANLRVTGVPDVIAAGDAARAVVDDQGLLALMCCQHAITMGKFAGHNAANALLGLPLVAYRQPYYVTCLDLGPQGAMFSTGREHTVRLPPPAAKLVKQGIMAAIEPPRGSRAEILDAAAPHSDFAAAMERRIAQLGGGT